MSGMWLVVLILIPHALAAGELVSVPWEEVKGLYQEKAERKAMEKMKTETAKRPPVYTIDEGVYRLSIGKDSAEGTALVSGRVVDGSPGPIPVFGREMVVGSVRSATGGSLLCGQGTMGEFSFCRRAPTCSRSN